MDSFKAWFNSFKETFTGKLVLSAARAFVGVFILAEAQVFDAIANGNWSALKSLLVALVAAGATAAVRAVQHFLFDN